MNGWGKSAREPFRVSNVFANGPQGSPDWAAMPSSDWAVCLKPAPRAALRLICFPYAGGGAAVFHSWAGPLGPNIEVWAVRAPGRESRFHEALLSTFDELLAETVAGLHSALDAPFALFGHSLGALLAFEVARTRQRQGKRQPAALIVSGSRPPHIPFTEPSIGHLPDESFIAALSSRYQGIPAEVLAHRELLELCLPVLRADIQVVESYRLPADGTLACPLTAIGGLHDPLVSSDDLSAWKEHTSGAFAVRCVRGDHFFLNRSTAVVLDFVREALHKTAS